MPPRIHYIDLLLAERDRRLSGGAQVVIDGVTHWIQTGEVHRQQIMGLHEIGASIPPVEWTTYAGAKVPMTAPNITAFYKAVAMMDLTLASVVNTHKQAIATRSDYWNHDIYSGWPLTYLEAPR